MKPRTLLLARGAAVAVAASLLSPAATAQTEQTEPTPAVTAFKLGQMFVEERRYDAACPKFEESYRLDPRVNTLFHLANCWSLIGRLGAARTRFLEVADTADKAGQSDLAASARQHAASIEAKLPLLTIEVKGMEPGLELSIDGAALGSAAWGTPVPLDPGKHTIEARAPHRRARKLMLEMPRDPQNLTVAVPPLDDESGKPGVEAAPAVTAPKSATGEPPRSGSINGAVLATGIVFAGLGVAGIVIGTVSGLKVNAKNGDADAACPTGQGCSPAEIAAYHAAIADAKSARNLSLTAFSIGGAALLGSVVLIVSAPREGSRPFALAPAFDYGAVGATFSGRW
jgi:hypothetical protein